MKKQGVILLRWANKCNNNCAMCSLHSGDSEEEVMSIEEALDFTRKNAASYQNIEFTGGEPTIKEGLVDLVAAARESGYERIAISTNGRRLSDENFCRKLIDNGLNAVTFALHGHDVETHEKRMSRSDGAFNEAIRGLKNLITEHSVSLNVASVLARHNHETFSEIGKMLIEMGVKQWSISDLIPDGRAQDIYDSLSLSPSEAEKAISGILPMAGQIGLVIFNFSRCFFPRDLDDRILFFDTRDKADLCNIERKEGRYEKEGEVYHDFHKTYLGICEKCPAYETCGGVWRRNMELYGEGIMTEVARRNGF
ncbi:MAG: radical SAM protein [Candidatus Colwellbacteria bacterium]|nr:radical SAM protein [Candidatus Colwellbacteria bacterium]